MKMFINPPKFRHEFEKGFGYEATCLIDNGWEKVELTAVDEDERLIATEETKWVKHQSFFGEWRMKRSFQKAEKKLHREMELYYKKNIFFCSIFETKGKE